MAKTKKNNNDDDGFFLELATQTGGKLLKGIGASRYFIDTGNLALNYLCSGKFFGGGVPTGISEFFGPSMSAKTLLGYTVMGGCQRMNGYAILLDCERQANETFAVTAGHVDENKMIVQTPVTIEQVGAKIRSIITKIREAKGMEMPILFVWDSIGVTPCEREYREMKLPENYTKEQYKKIVGGNEQPGERAKIAGKILRQINPFLDDNNASLFVINQTRASIGTYMQDETTAGGGKALPFYANCRVRTSAAKHIEDKKRKLAIGVNLKFANKKSRSVAPFLKTEGIQLFFNKGINPISGLLSVLIAAGRVDAVGGGGNYIVVGTDVKFKASLERNDVPIELLYQCPQLVDANDKEQIRQYLGGFAEAIELSNSDNVEETSVADDSDTDLDLENLES